MNILILQASPRAHGNTAWMADEYKNAAEAAAHNVGTKSVETEPGVICIFPMQVKEQPNTIRIVEIYRDKEAYQAHLRLRISSTTNKARFIW